MVPMVTAPVFTWTGFYLGGNVGYSWGDWNRAGLAGGTGISKPSVDGWLLGIQGGYNWQISPIWVVGLEVISRLPVRRPMSLKGDRSTSNIGERYRTIKFIV